MILSIIKYYNDNALLLVSVGKHKAKEDIWTRQNRQTQFVVTCTAVNSVPNPHDIQVTYMRYVEKNIYLV